MSDNWYSMDDLPFGRVHVRVLWNARVFAAARAVHPNTKRLTWCVYKSGDVVWLPPKREADRWTQEPERWQPLDASKWGQPLPEPLPVQVTPRMHYDKMRFETLTDAEAAELARQIQRDREDAQTYQPMDQQTPLEGRWWLDATNIRYEPKGTISKRMAEGRVLRALAFCGAGKGLTLRTTTVGSLLARMAEAASLEARAYDDTRHGLPRFQPLPSDHEDFDTALAWVTAINPPELWHNRRRAWSLNRTQRIMLMRTYTVPLSWADIGHEFSISGSRSQQIYAKGMEACWRVANGDAAVPGRVVVDQIEALRERNRAHKRRAL